MKKKKTRDKIPCDLQGFADDLALLATTEAPKVNGLQCFDAETLREMTQKSLEHIDTWCKRKWTITKCTKNSLGHVYMEKELAGPTVKTTSNRRHRNRNQKHNKIPRSYA